MKKDYVKQQKSIDDILKKFDTFENFLSKQMNE